jgi:hypothetical protein
VPNHNGRRGAPIHPGRGGTLVPADPIPGHEQKRGIGNEVEQIIEPAMRIIASPTVQLGLDLQYQDLHNKSADPPSRCSSWIAINGSESTQGEDRATSRLVVAG